jgi:drug/metabolite transporter (DMT)-like permease
MSLIWIPLTITAAFLQNLRMMLQKQLKNKLGTTGATFVRFGYGFPIALFYLLGLTIFTDLSVPRINLQFLLIVTSGGLAQIIGTALLVSLFDKRNFAVGTTYSKTETVQAAVFGIIFLGDAISFFAAIGILVSLVGVILISVARNPLGLKAIFTSWTEKPALVGLASGASFGIAAVSFRGASLSLGGSGFIMQASVTLAFALVFQTIVMATYMLIKEPTELINCLKAWRIAMWVGLCGALASIGWFTAMTIQQAALVRALGQLELVFTITTSTLIFKEKISRIELLGISIVVLGIIILLLR